MNEKEITDLICQYIEDLRPHTSFEKKLLHEAIQKACHLASLYEDDLDARSRIRNDYQTKINKAVKGAEHIEQLPRTYALTAFEKGLAKAKLSMNIGDPIKFVNLVLSGLKEVQDSPIIEANRVRGCLDYGKFAHGKGSGRADYQVTGLAYNLRLIIERWDSPEVLDLFIRPGSKCNFHQPFTHHLVIDDLIYSTLKKETNSRELFRYLKDVTYVPWLVIDS